MKIQNITLANIDSLLIEITSFKTDNNKMEIEDLIDKKSRIKQGIFFTKHHVVNDIISHMDFNKVQTVIDSAAGSCNFLISLAKKHPHIQFYGVEKNQIIFETVSNEIKDLENLHYFHGDILLDKFPIPKCDLYLGNPPFINFSDLDESYRDQIKPIWLNYFPKSTGFKMLLGDSRGDIAQLIFSYTIDKYLQSGARIGVILPNSLIKGNSASAGFREFKNITAEKLIDISGDDAFDNTARNCFYILGRAGGTTLFPIKYLTEGRIIQLIKSGDDLIEDGKSILRTSYYKARQGINTLGANSVFFFKKEVPFKSPLIKPLLKSSDITPFSYSPSYKVLFPYEAGKPIPEEKLEIEHPEVYQYLQSQKELLINRKSRFAQRCWYALFGIGPYTSMEYKVVWRGLGAKKLMAAVTKNVIPNQSMNCYIASQNSDEAHFICAIMNSELYREQLKQLNEEGAKSFAQPNTINKIYIPKFENTNPLHTSISGYSERLHNSINPKILVTLEQLIKDLYIEEELLQ